MRRYCDTYSVLHSAHPLGHYDYTNVPVSLLCFDDRLTLLKQLYAPAAYRHDLQIPPVRSTHPTPKGWMSHVHPQGSRRHRNVHRDISLLRLGGWNGTPGSSRSAA